MRKWEAEAYPIANYKEWLVNTPAEMVRRARRIGILLFAEESSVCDCLLSLFVQFSVGPLSRGDVLWFEPRVDHNDRWRIQKKTTERHAVPSTIIAGQNKMLAVVSIKIIIIISEGNNYCDYFPTHSFERFMWALLRHLRKKRQRQRAREPAEPRQFERAKRSHFEVLPKSNFDVIVFYGLNYVEHLFWERDDEASS